MPGFLGTRGSFMLDVVVVGMLVCLPLLAYSVYAVRTGRNYILHRRLQILIALILAVAVVAFELEMRIWGWEQRAEPSRFWVPGPWNDWIDRSLAVHLCFAIPTPLLWGWVLFRAWRDFDKPPRPNSSSSFHRRWGKLAAIGLVATAVTGWAFYWAAFVA